MSRVKAETFSNHAMFNKKNPFIRMNGVYSRNKMEHRTVCPKCSALTLTDTRKTDAARKFKTCVICGWHGSPEETLTLREALKDQTIEIGGKLYLR